MKVNGEWSIVNIVRRERKKVNKSYHFNNIIITNVVILKDCPKMNIL